MHIYLKNQKRSIILPDPHDCQYSELKFFYHCTDLNNIGINKSNYTSAFLAAFASLSTK